MLQHDSFEWEAKEEQADSRFLIILGFVLFTIALSIVVITIIVPAVEQINAVGNLIIIR